MGNKDSKRVTISFVKRHKLLIKIIHICITLKNYKN